MPLVAILVAAVFIVMSINDLFHHILQPVLAMMDIRILGIAAWDQPAFFTIDPLLVSLHPLPLLLRSIPILLSPQPISGPGAAYVVPVATSDPEAAVGLPGTPATNAS